MSVARNSLSAPQRCTIARLARELGVSKSTVSHAFSGRRTVSEDLRQRILVAARRLNYRPYYAAQALARKQTRTVGLLMNDLANEFDLKHVQAVAHAADARGYRITLAVAGDDEAKACEHLDSFVNGGADGVLLWAIVLPDRVITEVADQGYPVGTPLRVIPGHEDLCSVRLDIAATFERLLEYLYSIGHRRFGFVCGPLRAVPERHASIFDFARRHGLEFGPENVAGDVVTTESADVVAHRLLLAHPEITALVCSDDCLAVGALMAARRLGLTVPADLTVTGCDDIPMSRCCMPPLTTVRLPIAEMTAIAVDNLLDRIHGKPQPATARIVPELIIRDSSAPPRVRALTPGVAP